MTTKAKFEQRERSFDAAVDRGSLQAISSYDGSSHGISSDTAGGP